MAAEVAIAVCTKIVEYTMKPILSPIVRPFKYLLEYRSNLESLPIKMEVLDTKVAEVQGYTVQGANHLQAVQDWNDRVTEISNEVATITDPETPQQSMNCGQRFSCSNLKQRCLHRKDVAGALEKIDLLNNEATKSENEWKDKSNLQNLMKLKEDLEAARDERKNSIKEGEEALPDAKKWLGKVDNLIVEISNTIRSQPPTRQCCKRFTCLKCYDRRQDVDRKLNEVRRLLEQGSGFEVFSGPTEETKYKRSLDDLKKEVEELKVERQSEKLSREGGDVSVHSWQNNVEKIIVKVSRLDEEYSPDRVEEVDKLQKEVVERFAEAKRLKKAREEKEISIQLIQEEPWSQSIKSLQPLDSRTSILEEIMAKLREPDTDIIGIHGLGGIGKTTLAKQVANRCMEEQIVDKFAFVEVSQLPNVKKIQQEIGCKLGLSFGENENIPQRARKLHQQLKDSKKTLLILDNVWECFDFESLGIPCKDDRNGLKLLMTARSLDVIKDERGSSSYNFNIEALKWEDAWNLFGRKANISKECKDDSLEVEVAKKCGGMPLAIVTIASALSDKKTHEWRIALRKLSQPSADNFNGVTGIVYGSIELSYEYLKTDELKEAFLLCCSLPNTNDASVEDLLRYGIGLGLFINCQTLEETRDIVLSWLTTLKSSSLLVDAPEHGYDLFPYTERFAVHDVVCEVARSIAQKNKSALRVSGSVILPLKKWLWNCTHLTLDDVELSESLPLQCPQLRFLYLKPKPEKYYTRVRISGEFFAGMSSLEVLHLRNVDLISTSLGSLVNLQMLCLEICKWNEIDIGDLKNLQILSFSNCEMNLLSEKFFHLTDLPIIELINNRIMEENDVKLDVRRGIRVDLKRLISRLKGLEALYISGADVAWEDEKSNNESTAAGDDVLKYLTSLIINVPNAEMLRGLLSPELKRFNITVGRRASNVPWGFILPSVSSTRSLVVTCGTEVEGIISKLKGIKLEAQGMTDNFIAEQPDLGYLEVSNNSHLFCIFQKVSPNCLRTLVLWDLRNLKTISKGPTGQEGFLQLRTLRVHKCSKLTHVFWLGSDKEFQQLEEIEVRDCENMKVIFATRKQVHDIKLSKLKILKLEMLPKFESLSGTLITHGCPVPISLPQEKSQNFTKLDGFQNLEGLSFQFHIEFPMLSTFVIKNCSEVKSFIFDDKMKVPNLEKVVIENMNNIEIIWSNQFVEHSILKLKSLEVNECKKLKSLFTWNVCRKLSCLVTLEIRSCDSLEEICCPMVINSVERTSIESKELRTTLISFEKLKCMEVSKCQNLKYMFEKEIVEEKETHTATMELVFPILDELKLYKLPRLRAFYPNEQTVHMPVLKNLILKKCCTPETPEEDHRMQQLLAVGKAFPPLEILSMSPKDLMMMWEPGPLFQNFTTLSIADDDCSDDDEPGLHIVCSDDDDVECMREEMFKLELILQHFQTIQIDEVESFVSLVPPSASLQNLTTLTIAYCDSLEDIGAFSIVKNLINLIHLEIKYCKRIAELVRNDGDISDIKIVFHNMKILVLVGLSSLKSFCSLNLFLEFRSLEELEVRNCPNMKIFCGGDINTPNLHKLKWSWKDSESIEVSEEMDVNRAIQQVQYKFKEKAKGYIDFSLPMKDEGDTDSLSNADQGEGDTDAMLKEDDTESFGEINMFHLN